MSLNSTAFMERSQALWQACGATCEGLSASGEPTYVVSAHQWLACAQSLRDDPECSFEQLIDLCGVDYLTYGAGEWATEASSNTGFDRAVSRDLHDLSENSTWQGERFAVVVHLLSLKHNQRVRVRIPLAQDPPQLPSVVSIWASANWYEREAYDLFGFFFHGHPDLRRLLTDYGFQGHPFRKDFPLIGRVEVRYDASAGRVIQEPVSIEERVLVPRVVRHEPAVEDKVRD